MIRIFSVFYWVFVFATMPFLFLVALVLFVLTVAFDRRRFVNQMWSCFWASFYIYCNPIWRSRIRGREKLPWHGPAVLVANHLSLVDILVLYGLYRPFKWVSKAELFKVPCAGWNMVLNDYVRLRRGDRHSIREMMDHCRRHLSQGSPVLIFPEGTRSPTGELQAFKDGAFRLALEAGVPVIPIAVKGTYETMPKQGVLIQRSMSAEVQVLDPLDPKDFVNPGELRDAAREAIRRSLSGEVRPAPLGSAEA